MNGVGNQLYDWLDVCCLFLAKVSWKITGAGRDQCYDAL